MQENGKFLIWSEPGIESGCENARQASYQLNYFFTLSRSGNVAYTDNL